MDYGKMRKVKLFNLGKQTCEIEENRMGIEKDRTEKKINKTE